MPAPIKTVSDFRVAGSSSAFPESDAHVVALANGQFDVAWTQDCTSIDPVDMDVRITRVNADGTSALTGSESGSVAPRGLADDWEMGGSVATLGTMQVVAYSDAPNRKAAGVIRIDFYDATDVNNASLKGKSVVVDATAGNKISPEVTVLKDGKLAVVYVDAAAASVKARVYDPATGKFTSGPFTLSKAVVSKADPALDLGLTALSTGGFATSWQGADGLGQLRVTDAAGKTTFAFTGTQALGHPTDVLETGTNKLALVSMGPSNNIKFTTVDLVSKKASASIEVAAYGKNPDAVLLADGRIMIVWSDGGDIVGRIVKANGKPDSYPFVVTDTADELGRPHLAKLADGRVAISYENASKGDIYATVFDPREAAVSLKGTGGDDQFYGTRFADKFAMGLGNDKVWAGAGNDTIDGGVGADKMAGGTGDDTFVVDDAFDQTIEAAGEGNDTVRSSISWALAKNVEVLQLTGTANIDGKGNGSASTVIGNSGNNNIASAGTMIGGAGDDTYENVTGSEKIVEAVGGGTDTIKLLASEFELGAGIEIERIVAADAKSTAATSVTGNEFAQTIEGTAGNNTLDGKEGADKLIGFGGDDTYVVDNSGDRVIEEANAGTDTVLSSISWTLGANLENLTLTGTANTSAVGNGARNILTGNDGSNLLWKAGAGGTMIGGLGDDTYLVSGGETIVEAKGGGNDRVDVEGFVYSLAAGIEIERLSSVYMLRSDGVALSGNEFGQRIQGSMGDDFLDGRGGADTLEGFWGNDTYKGVTGSEIIIEGAKGGTDTIKLATTSYTLAAGVEIERISAEGLAYAYIFGNEFAQTIEGTAGDDYLNGKGGADTLIGQAGDDVYVVDDIGDKIVELNNGGNDTVRAEINWTLDAYTENLVLTGTGNTEATGNGDNNTLTGNTGSNVFRNAGHAGTMIGDLGDDTFFIKGGETIVESKGSGFDSIILETPVSSYTIAAGVEVEQLSTIYSGSSVAVELTGNEFSQTIVGTYGNNILDGKGGSDTLFGLLGDDAFRFSTALGADNVDHIVQFDKTADDQDRIFLDDAIFTALSPAGGPLSANLFTANADGIATDADNRIVYETDTGKLFYDADGSGKGAAILFAVLDDRAALTASDIFVV